MGFPMTRMGRILEWVAIPSPGDLPNPEIEPVSCIVVKYSLSLSHLGSLCFFVEMSG